MSNLARRNGQVQVTSNSYLAPASSYTVTVYPVGAQASATSSGATITVRAGHGFAAGDKFIKSDGTAFSGTDTVQSVTSTSIVMGTSHSITSGDVLINLGPDGGTSTPAYTASPINIYNDMAGASTALDYARVTTGTDGQYGYWTDTKAVWELIRSSSGTVVDYVMDASLEGGKLVLASGNTIVFEGATDDAYETTVTVTDPTADNTITIPNETGTVLTTVSAPTVTGNWTYGDASTDTYTHIGRMIVRTISTDPTSSATAGTIGEIVYSSSTAKFYGKHTGTASDTNWRLLGT